MPKTKSKSWSCDNKDKGTIKTRRGKSVRCSATTKSGKNGKLAWRYGAGYKQSRQGKVYRATKSPMQWK